MNWGGSELLILLLAAALVAAAVGDLKSRTIPNWLNGAIALGAIVYWVASGLDPWPDMALRLGVALAVFALFAGAFAIGMMGGGDVKLLGAVALWLPPGGVLFLLVAMSLAGGALTVAMWARHKLRRSSHTLEIPYGVAIAFGGLWLIGERFLNQFG
ncbi:MAG TPA: prepilin peptidase [Allosphingosinicella sp.]|jgi:prepilin peptidase CpaA